MIITIAHMLRSARSAAGESCRHVAWSATTETRIAACSAAQGPRSCWPRGPSLTRRLTCWVALAGALLLPHSALAERAIDLPFVEHFDQNDYSDVIWVTGGATHSWQSTGGWSGGAARFTRPTTGNSYSGLGSFVGLANDNAQQINIRVLVRHGTNYLSDFAGAKFMIVVRDPNDSDHQRPMLYDGMMNDGTRDVLSYAPALGTYCQWDNDDYGGCWMSDHETFKAYPGHYLDDWVSIELEFIPATGYANLYITTRDNAFHGLYLTKIPMEGCAYSTPQTGGGLDYVDIIGGYFNNPTPAGANRYFEFDELQVDDHYIGPPPGFVVPACATAADCQQPPACHAAAGASCNAGSCAYTAAPDGTSCAGGACSGGACVAADAGGSQFSSGCGAAGAGVFEPLSALVVWLLFATRRRRP